MENIMISKCLRRSKNSLVIAATFVLVALTAVGCSFFDSAPVKVYREHYQAIEKLDYNAYLNTLTTRARESIDENKVTEGVLNKTQWQSIVQRSETDRKGFKLLTEDRITTPPNVEVKDDKTFVNGAVLVKEDGTWKVDKSHIPPYWIALAKSGAKNGNNKNANLTPTSAEDLVVKKYYIKDVELPGV